MLKRTILATALVCAATGAGAADLTSATPPLLSPTPVFSWTGFYVGANAGYAWDDGKTRYDYLFTPDVTPDEIAEFYALGVVPTQLGKNDGGFIGGGQVGYNQQLGSFVLGVEADLQYVGGKRSDSYLFVGGDEDADFDAVTTNESGVEWLGTLRARAGVTFDRALIYATGGLAFGGVKNTTTLSTNVDDSLLGQNSTFWAGEKNDTRTGWTIGGGFEYAFTSNLSAKVEYLYYNLGNASHTLAPISIPDDEDDFLGGIGKRKFEGSIVRAGLNYRFSTY